MKTNEAPEKIYAEIKHPFSEEYTEMIAFEDGDGIEYTRTDAFIDKTCEWINDNYFEYLQPISYNEQLKDSIDINAFVNDLKKQ